MVGEAADFPRRRLAALGQFADLGRNHGKATTVLASAGRFDRGIERQQVGLIGDLFDD